jgi:hypothetical protein
MLLLNPSTLQAFKKEKVYRVLAVGRQPNKAAARAVCLTRTFRQLFDQLFAY